MEKELSILPSFQQKKDTLFFLINEFFVKSNLSKLEVISNSKDEELSILMEELYKITTFIDITKELVKEKLIESGSQSQFSSTLNKSVINSKRKFKPLLTEPENRMRLSSIKKHTPTRPFLNYTQKQPFKRDVLSNSSNQLTNHRIDRNNQDKTKASNFTIKRRPKQLNDIHIDGIDDNNLNTNHFNSGHSSSHRNTFKFEPRKKTLLKVIQSVEINDKKEHVIKIKVNNQSNNTKKNIQKNNLNKIDNIFTNKNNFKILENIFLFLPNSNNLINLTKNTRKIFLVSKIKEIENKIVKINNSNEEKKQTTQNESKNEIDKILELELLKHKEVKLKEFLQKYE